MRGIMVNWEGSKGAEADPELGSLTGGERFPEQ